MNNSIFKFLAYNNAVPIMFGVLFLGSGVAFAASTEVRSAVSSAVYSKDIKVVEIDNTYIANKSLTTFTPTAKVVNVDEDTVNYYVKYEFKTIALKDSVWQDVVEPRVLKVRKKDLVNTDLGEYVTEQLRQDVEGNLAFLKEVQKDAKKHVTTKVIATSYGGLVGKMVDDSTEKVPKYIPVSTPLPVVSSPTLVSNAVNPQNSAPLSNQLTIKVLGSNPANISVRKIYSDLGVVVVNDQGSIVDLGVSLALNGKKVSSISVDTSVVGVWIVKYSSEDSKGNIATAQRVVNVYDPTTTATTTTTAPPVSTSTTTPTTVPSIVIPTPDVATTTATTTTTAPPVSTSTTTPTTVPSIVIPTPDVATTTATTTTTAPPVSTSTTTPTTTAPPVSTSTTTPTTTATTTTAPPVSTSTTTPTTTATAS